MTTPSPNFRLFCIGRNYREHAKELNNAIPKEPVIFMKPATALVGAKQAIPFPTHGADLQHEVEVVVQIGKAGRATTEAEALSFIDKIGLGLDLTLRDVQNQLKQQGLPWEKAKAFDGSATLGPLKDFAPTMDLQAIDFSCYVNNELKQQGNTKEMIFTIPTLIIAISAIWQLLPGDLLYTGTPAGVGSLYKGDTVKVSSKLLGSEQWPIN